MRLRAEHRNVVGLRRKPPQLLDRAYGGHAVADDDQARLAPRVTLRQGPRPQPNLSVADFYHVGGDCEPRLLETSSRNETVVLLVNSGGNTDFFPRYPDHAPA